MTQDYNYIWHGCMEVTLELSCCKFPPAAELQVLFLTLTLIEYKFECDVFILLIMKPALKVFFLFQGFWEDNRKSLLRFLGESHRGVKGFVKDENFAPIEGASMKVTFRRCLFNLI